MNSWEYEPTLFDSFAIPSHINKDQLLAELMVQCGEMEVHITRPSILKQAIGFWSQSRKPIWERIAAIQDFEYNPIWNVDGVTIHSGKQSGKRSYDRNRDVNEHEESTTNNTSLMTDDLGETENISEEETQTSTTTGTLAADNSESWSNDTKTEFSQNTDKTIERSRDQSETQNTTGRSNTITDNNLNEKITDGEKTSHNDDWTDTRQGNIGVTTTQKMMTEELEFWNQYNLYDIIIREFKKHFCIMLY